MTGTAGHLTDDLRRRSPEVHGPQSWTARPLRDEMVGPAAPALRATAVAAAASVGFPAVGGTRASLSIEGRPEQSVACCSARLAHACSAGCCTA